MTIVQEKYAAGIEHPWEHIDYETDLTETRKCLESDRKPLATLIPTLALPLTGHVYLCGRGYPDNDILDSGHIKLVPAIKKIVDCSKQQPAGHDGWRVVC